MTAGAHPSIMLLLTILPLQYNMYAINTALQVEQKPNHKPNNVDCRIKTITGVRMIIFTAASVRTMDRDHGLAGTVEQAI
jgi:hypothetical protein